MNEQNLELYEKLYLRRKQLGLTQEEVATRARISRNYVSSIERGFTASVSPWVLRKVCKALKMELILDAKITNNTEVMS
jgi:transcriptional regulator with XRE-family HTH domain